MTVATAVDLHLHSTASDGTLSPAGVVRRAAAVPVTTIALTDHDTVAGVSDARRAGAPFGIQVIAGCEFSVQAWWGELHLLGYFLPLNHSGLDAFFREQRERRAGRAEEMVRALARLGAAVSLDAVSEEAGPAPVGRPHVARALVKAGRVDSIEQAFARYLADGGPAYVQRPLPRVEEVAEMVRRLGGVTSAAHLKQRGTRVTLRRLKDVGVDGVEVRHPSHSPDVAAALEQRARKLGMLMTGGSDWHGPGGRPGAGIGDVAVPLDWVDALHDLHRRRSPP